MSVLSYPCAYHGDRHEGEPFWTDSVQPNHFLCKSAAFWLGKASVEEYLVGWTQKVTSRYAESERQVFKLVEAGSPTEAIEAVSPPLDRPCIVVATRHGSRLMRRMVTEIVVADVDVS